MKAEVTHQSNVCRKSSSVMSKKPRVGRAADVVDQNIDPAEALHGRAHDPFSVRTTHRVCDERQPLAALGLDTLNRANDVRLGTCGPDNRGARLGQHPGNACPDALPSAGDDRDLSVQPELLQCHLGSFGRV